MCMSNHHCLLSKGMTLGTPMHLPIRRYSCTQQFLMSVGTDCFHRLGCHIARPSLPFSLLDFLVCHYFPFVVGSDLFGPVPEMGSTAIFPMRSLE